MKTLPNILFISDFEASELSLGFLQCSSQQLLPLDWIHYHARLSGAAASVTVEQQFTNRRNHPIEALYVFPLSGNSAVHQMTVTIGERVLEGRLQEKKAARQSYERGMNAGHRSVLVEQADDNVFRANVGNIPAGETVTVSLTYAEKLTTAYGETELRLPMTITPRWSPGGVCWGEKRQNTRARTAVSIEIDGVPTSMRSSQHALVARHHQGKVCLEFDRGVELLDRDLVVRYSLAESNRASARAQRFGDHFMVSIHPPVEQVAQQVARDVVILFDRSGSMSGHKMTSCQRAVMDYLEHLNPQDRYLLVAFDNAVEYFAQEFQPAWTDGRPKQWVQGVQARGGTDIGLALQAAYRANFHPDHQPVVVLMTDGEVGNENEIYRIAQEAVGRMRIFTLGIGATVNDAFLRRVAELGRGSCELVTPGDDLERSVRRLAAETSTPVITDLEVFGVGPTVSHITPARLPDLYAARPVHLTGAIQGEGRIRVQGRLAGSSLVWEAEVEPEPCDNRAIPILWARDQVRQIEDDLRLSAIRDRAGAERRITEVALEFGLMTRFTSFVVVDKAEVVAPFGCQTVVQPMEPLRAAPMGGMLMCQAISADAFGAPAPCAETSGALFGSFECEEAPAADLFSAAPSRRRGLIRPGLGGGALRKSMLGHAKSDDKPKLERRQAAPKQDSPVQAMSQAIDQYLAQRMTGAELVARLAALLVWLKASGGIPHGLLKEGEELSRQLAGGAPNADMTLTRWFRKVKLSLHSAGWAIC
ncbi:MAG: VIT and VWA domain-containing protein [Vulcanimicrobiota bacterium]